MGRAIPTPRRKMQRSNRTVRILGSSCAAPTYVGLAPTIALFGFSYLSAALLMLLPEHPPHMDGPEAVARLSAIGRVTSW